MGRVTGGVRLGFKALLRLEEGEHYVETAEAE